jgi:hypothetical protein
VGICDFPDGIFDLVGGASNRFCVAGFESHCSGRVFLNDMIILFLELLCHNVNVGLIVWW